MKFNYLVFCFTIFHELNSHEVAYFPFKPSLYALEKHFIISYEKMSNPYQWACMKVYSTFRYDQTKNENLSKSCDAYILPKDSETNIKIGFIYFSSYSGLEVAVEACICTVIRKEDRKILYFDNFALVRLDLNKYFVIHTPIKGKTLNYLNDYIELTEAVKTNNQPLAEIEVGKQVSRVNMDLETLEKKFQYDSCYPNHDTYGLLGISDIYWDKISPESSCLEFYTSFKKTYHLRNKGKYDFLFPNCYTIHRAADHGYKIKYSNLPNQDQLNMDLMFCDCYTTLSNFSYFKKNNVDETHFYLTKLVEDAGNNFYYLLVDDVNPQYLNVIGYFQVENKSIPKDTGIEDGIPNLSRPVTDMLQIQNNFFINYNLEKAVKCDWASLCVKMYSTIKLIDIQRNSNFVKSCNHKSYPQEEVIHPTRTGIRRRSDLLMCSCWEHEYSADGESPKFEEVHFYVAKVIYEQLYYRLKKDSDGRLIWIDYIQFL